MIALRESTRRCQRPMNRYFHLRQNENFGFIAPSIPTPTPSCTHRHRQSQSQSSSIASTRRHYFTNTDQMKKSDPYAALGLSWGATTSEIKDAYRNLARRLHPDVSDLDPSVALSEFRRAKEAYDALLNNNNNNNGIGGAAGTESWEEWSFAVWRGGDVIAQERTDVAGKMRKRPAKPAESVKRRSWGVASLGHPDGRGASVVTTRGEYLASGGGGREGGTQSRSATVGTGRNKWVEKKREFRPWNPEDGAMKGISRNRKNIVNEKEN